MSYRSYRNWVFQTEEKQRQLEFELELESILELKSGNTDGEIKNNKKCTPHKPEKPDSGGD